MTLRNLARIGATGALAVGGLGFAATPALAADVDFGVRADDAVIAADAEEKFVGFTITNDGTTKPDKVEVVYDFTGVDLKKVRPFAAAEDCTGTTLVTCVLPGEAIPGAGASADELVPVTVLPDAKGAAGTLKVTVKVAGDTNKANDSTTFKVSIGDSGADLAVVVDDVTVAEPEKEATGRPVAPGATAPLRGVIVNQGDLAAAGLTLEIKLPEQTTFVEDFEGCSPSIGKRTLTCKTDSVLPQFDPERFEETAIEIDFPVRVSADAKGPVSLKGGVATVTAHGEKAFSARQSRTAAAEQPKWAAREVAAKAVAPDVDPADNTDEFAVLVAAATGGNAGGGADEGDNGDGGGLPVTGPSGLAIGGGGLAAIALGLGLFLTARRRRVVLVTPGDER